jgi:hypothetical protein
MKAHDMVGFKNGRLTVEARVGTSAKRDALWLCRCDCGGETTLPTQLLRKVISCGCYRRELLVERLTTHGKTTTAEYTVWQGMRRRCTDSRNRAFKRYGGRGIYVCERWADFANFYADMGARPSADHQLDRIDNDGPYAPNNCRWVLRTENCRNRSTTHLITIGGTTASIERWSELSGVPAWKIRQRINEFGFSPELAIRQEDFRHRDSRRAEARIK